MKIIKVRFKGAPTPCLYVGRRLGMWPGHPLANPFTRKDHRDPITPYAQWLADNVARGTRHVVQSLDAITADHCLGCWCLSMDNENWILHGRPQCHAQVIWRMWMRWMATGRGMNGPVVVPAKELLK